MFKRLGSHFERETSWKAAVVEHRAVVKAIALHDPEMARKAMVHHLDCSHDRFSSGWPTSDDRDGKQDTP